MSRKRIEVKRIRRYYIKDSEAWSESSWAVEGKDGKFSFLDCVKLLWKWWRSTSERDGMKIVNEIRFTPLYN